MMATLFFGTLVTLLVYCFLPFDWAVILSAFVDGSISEKISATIFQIFLPFSLLALGLLLVGIGTVEFYTGNPVTLGSLLGF